VTIMVSKSMSRKDQILVPQTQVAIDSLLKVAWPARIQGRKNQVGSGTSHFTVPQVFDELIELSLRDDPVTIGVTQCKHLSRLLHRCIVHGLHELFDRLLSAELLGSWGWRRDGRSLRSSCNRFRQYSVLRKARVWVGEEKSVAKLTEHGGPKTPFADAKTYRLNPSQTTNELREVNEAILVGIELLEERMTLIGGAVDV